MSKARKHTEQSTRSQQTLVRPIEQIVMSGNQTQSRSAAIFMNNTLMG